MRAAIPPLEVLRIEVTKRGWSPMLAVARTSSSMMLDLPDAEILFEGVMTVKEVNTVLYAE